MGGDGGSIPKRDDLVKTRSKPEQVGKNAEILARWKHCALTQDPLRAPIVSCELGRLFNKESFIEFLLDRSKFECSPKFSYIRGLKDVKELRLVDNPAYTDEKSKVRAGCVGVVSPYICPLTGLEMNGRYKFCYLLSCGCVFSDRALREIKDFVCAQCGKSYADDDIVTINGTDEEVAELERRMTDRRLVSKSAKGSKKRKADSAAAAEGCVDTTSSATDDTTAKSTAACTTSAIDASGGDGARKVQRVPTTTSSKPTSTSSVAKGDKRPKSVQDDPKASEVFKSLFNTHETAKKQPQAHWVTYNPQYF